VVAELTANGEAALPELSVGTYMLHTAAGVLRWMVL